MPDDERRATYERLWREGGVKFALGSYRDLITDEAANRTVSDFIREKIRETVKDPEIAEKLIPEHPFLSRRPIVDTNYFETYNRDDVTLVDLRSAPIVTLTPTGVRTADAEYPVDVLIFATGFDDFRLHCPSRGPRPARDRGRPGRRAGLDGAGERPGPEVDDLPHRLLDERRQHPR